MSTPPRLSDDATLKPLLKSIFKAAVKADDLYEITGKVLRGRLLEAGWTGPGASGEGWKAGGWKAVIEEQWQGMVSKYQDEQEQEQDEPEPKPTNKYDRVANRNFNFFTGAVAGDLLGGLAGDEEEDDDGNSFIASDSGVGASDETGSARDSSMDVVDSDAVDHKDEEEKEVPVKSKSKAKSTGKKEGAAGKSKKSSSSTADKPKKRTPSKKKKAEAKFKSKATISDSDDEGGSASGSGSGNVGGASSSVHSEGESEEERKKSKSKGNGKKKDAGEKKQRKKREPKLKEGDAPKGSEEEEDRIVKLKALLTHAGCLRPFNKETGAERTLSVSTRLARLEGLLNDLGLKCGSGVGSKMPSEGKCKDVGEARALEKEMKDLKGAPTTSGLRDGKKRASLDGEDDGRPKKKFGDFLSAFQSDSD
ncbi:hypothetical protein BCR35DRAFT_305551 [Leucosporidium creatinivorum]|uniref:Uncharacterized protein n=1 Tax=Leucosporidium creatinivorum TaxID=106004 RepID=A0A1Y2F0L0_9BASI|nr:hypothetical protein BCR35DRAFT_305551 [Leucosporidium creatinivorum]